MTTKPKAAKRVSVKAWGAFVSGNEVPDETFHADWTKPHVRRFLKEHRGWTSPAIIRPITITYQEPKHVRK